MITKKQSIAQIFSIFHDGDLIFEKEENLNHLWKIDCVYLAEIVNPKFQFFWVKVFNCKILNFAPWLKPITQKEEVWVKTEDIFKTDLEILSAKVFDEKVEIACAQNESSFNFSGGILTLDCGGIKVFDQNWTIISESTLKTISTKYWK